MIDLTWTSILLCLFLIGIGIGYAVWNERELQRLRRQEVLRARIGAAEHSARLKRLSAQMQRIAACPDPTLGVEEE